MRAHIHDGREPMSSTSRPDTLVRDQRLQSWPFSLATHRRSIHWVMTGYSRDDLWRDFPKPATEFEKRFATEEDCRAYWIEARWGGKPACARCGSTYVWPIRGGTTFECRECDHQTSLTSGTLLEKTRKPLKMWFRAVFEISTRRTGISAMDLMRIMGFGSYKTAWTWLHKLRA